MRRGKGTVDVDCPKCGKFLGMATSRTDASRLMQSHRQEDHRSIFEMF